MSAYDAKAHLKQALKDGIPASVIAELTGKRFSMTYCSQCGKELGPGNGGVSYCSDHRDPRDTKALLLESIEDYGRACADELPESAERSWNDIRAKVELLQQHAYAEGRKDESQALGQRLEDLRTDALEVFEPCAGETRDLVEWYTGSIVNILRGTEAA